MEETTHRLIHRMQRIKCGRVADETGRDKVARSRERCEQEWIGGHGIHVPGPGHETEECRAIPWVKTIDLYQEIGKRCPLLKLGSIRPMISTDRIDRTNIEVIVRLTS